MGPYLECGTAQYSYNGFQEIKIPNWGPIQGCTLNANLWTNAVLAVQAAI